MGSEHIVVVSVVMFLLSEWPQEESIRLGATKGSNATGDGEAREGTVDHSFWSLWSPNIILATRTLPAGSYRQLFLFFIVLLGPMAIGLFGATSYVNRVCDGSHEFHQGVH